ncbi:hypothetical protein Bbelb_110560 [Branchiostoma belcheri]|nr:hypothetical protein Bbelb_110560 [Branchiostoma belcheri]
MDATLSHPFRLTCAGSSGSGKSYFAKKLLTTAGHWIKPGPFEHVVWCYAEYQETLHRELGSKLGSKVQFVEGLPNSWTDVIKPGCRNVIVIDDLMIESAKDGDQRVTKLFTRASRHRDTSVISKEAGESPRDQSMITTLARQMYPGHSRFLQECYEDAVNKTTYGHLFLALHPESPQELRVRTNMLTPRPYVYLRKR